MSRGISTEFDDDYKRKASIAICYRLGAYII